VVGQGLAGRELLRADAACRPGGHGGQREQGANRPKSHNAIMRAPTAFGRTNGEDGRPASNGIWHATLLVQ
jgi:hypothetical protein